jgi:hypothetical protein
VLVLNPQIQSFEEAADDWRITSSTSSSGNRRQRIEDGSKTERWPNCYWAAHGQTLPTPPATSRSAHQRAADGKLELKLV